MYLYVILKYKWFIITACYTFCVRAGVVLKYADALHKKWPDQKFNLFFENFFTSVTLLQNKNEFTYQTGRPSRHTNEDIRYDRLDHLVIKQEKQTRCGYCHQRATTRCLKCDVAVHVQCFVDYHTKK